MNQNLLNRYLNGTVSEEERVQVFEWACADKENMKELAELRRLNDLNLWNHSGKRTGHRTVNRRLLYQVASVAAVFAILFGISAYLLTQTTSKIFMQTINVPPGQRVEVILADGSRVWLNAGSSFTFPTQFTKKSREVLLDGEGFFDVNKDGKRDFVVKTSTYEVKALGTTFNLMAYSQSPIFEVSLLSGSVEVSSPALGELIRLEPDTRAYLANNKLIKSGIEQYDQFLWKDGLICFDNEPFEKMAGKLELYFDVEIIITNPSLLTGKYTGKFRTKDGLEHILRVIQLKEKFSYEETPDDNVLIIK